MPSSRPPAALLLKFVAVVAAVWSIGMFVHTQFPYVRNGADVVAEAKWRWIGEDDLFRSDATTRIVVSGNSKVLAGFRPDLFADAADPTVDAINLGFPGDIEFLSKIRRLVTSGNAPTHVVLTQRWTSDETPPTWRDRVNDDKTIMAAVLPWRQLPRDLTLFAFRSLKGRNPVERYRGNEASVRRMIDDRGYYFIEAQSRFDGDRLPDDFAIATDQPDAPNRKPQSPRSWVVAELESMRRTAGFDVIVLPNYYRVGQWARADDPDRDDLPEGWTRRGPAYLLYPPECFSDPVHLNREGAACYTADLAGLMKDAL